MNELEKIFDECRNVRNFDEQISELKDRLCAATTLYDELIPVLKKQIEKVFGVEDLEVSSLVSPYSHLSLSESGVSGHGVTMHSCGFIQWIPEDSVEDCTRENATDGTENIKNNNDEKGDAIPFNLTGKKRSSIASELEDLPLSPIKKIKVEEEKTQ